MEELTEFAKGILFAAAIVQATSRTPVIAADILREAGLTHANCAELDDYDKENLRIVNKERGINLQNLD
ncbi:MAG: hypothetical protein Q7K26_01340 [bacterium]|nr:hypothetical protein [bacterium]